MLLRILVRVSTKARILSNPTESGSRRPSEWPRDSVKGKGTERFWQFFLDVDSVEEN